MPEKKIKTPALIHESDDNMENVSHVFLRSLKKENKIRVIIINASRPRVYELNFHKPCTKHKLATEKITNAACTMVIIFFAFAEVFNVFKYIVIKMNSRTGYKLKNRILLMAFSPRYLVMRSTTKEMSTYATIYRMGPLNFLNLKMAITTGNKINHEAALNTQNNFKPAVAFPPRIFQFHKEDCLDHI